MKIGIIGGTGLYQIEGVNAARELTVETPYGMPSDRIIEAEYDGSTLFFLPRHGKGHRFIPSKIPFRANIYALKSLGTEMIFSVSAVGSMKEEIEPGSLVIVDQFIDRTFKRESTFFDGGVAAHVSMADPVCPALRNLLISTAELISMPVHRKGTYICMEGPQFSSRGESLIYRTYGVDVIGMTNMPEAKLAREAEICYATVAVATDYDCWHVSEEAVNVDMVMKVLMTSTEKAKRLILKAISRIGEKEPCGCGEALRYAIVTDKNSLRDCVKKEYELLLGKYL